MQFLTIGTFPFLIIIIIIIFHDPLTLMSTGLPATSDKILMFYRSNSLFSSIFPRAVWEISNFKFFYEEEKEINEITKIMILIPLQMQLNLVPGSPRSNDEEDSLFPEVEHDFCRRRTSVLIFAVLCTRILQLSSWNSTLWNENEGLDLWLV